MAYALRYNISIEDLVLLRGDERVVHGVSACFSEARWHGLIGANGSGKTTLLRAIAGRLPIESGRCRIGGEERADDRAARARLIDFAPLPEMLPDALRIRDVLTITAGRGTDYMGRLKHLKEPLGLADLLDRRISACSAGMRQRAAIACAFAGGKRIVILDEPFNWLDPLAAYDVRLGLKAMVEEGLTLITALHDLTALVTSCTQATLLSNGEVALSLSEDDMAAAAKDTIHFERRMINALRSKARGHDA